MLQGNSALIRRERFSGCDRASLSRTPGPARTEPFLAIPELPPSFDGRVSQAFLSSLPNPIFRKVPTDAWDSQENNRATIPGPSLTDRERPGDRGSGPGKMMGYLCDFGDFVRRLRTQLRFGELSRASLQLLRLEWRAGIAECDWIARPPDRFDSELPAGEADRNASLQALKDAIGVRALLFRTLSNLETAVLRAYRQSASGTPQLIIEGTVSREQRAPRSVRSLVMRAKLLGFRFWLNGEVLRDLRSEDYVANS
jgi:hypothetical protein